MNRKAFILVEKILVTGDKTTNVYILKKRKKQSEKPLKTIKQILPSVESYVFRFSLAFAVTIISSFILVPIAEAERGYPALGGEWIALMLIFGLSLKGAKMIWEGFY